MMKFRQLIMVERVYEDTVVVVVPMLGMRMYFGMNKEEIPYECTAGLRFHAQVNSRAERSTELSMSDFELGEILTPERSKEIEQNLIDRGLLIYNRS